MNEMNKRRNTTPITIKVLLNLSNPVKCLFSQMISVGSEASTNSIVYPNNLSYPFCMSSGSLATVSAYCLALLIPSSFSKVKKAVTGLFNFLS